MTKNPYFNSCITATCLFLAYVAFYQPPLVNPVLTPPLVTPAPAQEKTEKTPESPKPAPFSTEPTITVDAAVKAIKGKEALIKLTTNGKLIRYHIDDQHLRIIANVSDPTAFWVFSAYPGDYKIWFWTSLGDMPSHEALCIVSVSEDTTPLPPVVDVLIKKLQAAYDSDTAAITDKAKFKASLMGFYDGMAQYVAAKDASGQYLCTTYEGFRKRLTEQAVLVLQNVGLTNARRVIADEVAAALGDDLSITMDDTKRAAVQSLCQRISKGLEGVK